VRYVIYTAGHIFVRCYSESDRDKMFDCMKRNYPWLSLWKGEV